MNRNTDEAKTKGIVMHWANYLYQIVLRQSLFQEIFYFWLNSCHHYPSLPKKLKLWCKKIKFYPSKVLCFVLQGWPHATLRKSWSLNSYGEMSWAILMVAYFGDLEWLCPHNCPQDSSWRPSRMKQLARGYVRWPPNLNTQLENTVRCCEKCQAVQSTPPKALLYPKANGLSDPGHVSTLTTLDHFWTKCSKW